MKTTKPPRLPKGRVMYVHPDSLSHEYRSALLNQERKLGTVLPVAVIPCKSAREAKALTRFFNLSPQDRIKALAIAMHDRLASDPRGKHFCGRNAEDAEACLKTIGAPLV
jgi:hypothetical protein